MIKNNKLYGNLDFQQYLAIAMLCDQGATLPAAPLDGQKFLHTPTGRRVLMEYANGQWNPIFNFGTTTVYVDPTGTDALDKGFGTGSDAYATPSYAYAQIAPQYSGNVTINLSVGTWPTMIADQRTPTGSYSITVNGTFNPTPLDSGTMTSGTAGGTSNRTAIVDTGKAWTVNQFQGKQVLTNLGYKLIHSNTANTLYLSATNNGTPSGTYTIYEYGTIISGAGNRNLVLTSTNISFNYIKFATASGQVGASSSGANMFFDLSNCWIQHNFGAGNWLHISVATMEIKDCFVAGAGSGQTKVAFDLRLGSEILLRENLFQWSPSTSRGFSAVTMFGGNLFVNYSNTFENLTVGVQFTDTVAQLFGSQGYSFWTNCGTAISIGMGCLTSLNTPNQVFSNNAIDVAEPSVQPTQGNTDIFTVKNAQGAARTRWDKFGNVIGDGRNLYGITAYQVNAAERLDYPRRSEGINAPSNPTMGDIWIDTN